MLNAPIAWPPIGVAWCSWGTGLLVRLAVGIALRLVWGMGRVVVVCGGGGYVAMVLSCVPGSILIALPPTNANLPCGPAVSARSTKNDCVSKKGERKRRDTWVSGYHQLGLSGGG